MSILQDSNDILEGIPAETLFASRPWFERWLAAFGRAPSGWWHPAGSLLLEFPYVIRPSRIGPLSVRVAWAAANSYTPKFDVCGIGTPTSEHFRAMMRELDVSMLVFPLLSNTSRLAQAVTRGDAALWWFRDFCEAAPYVDCTGSWEDYLKSRGRTRRRSWLSLERHALTAGMSVDTLSSWNEIAPHFGEMLAIEASGWKGRLGSSIAQSPILRAFYEGVCQSFAIQNALRVFVLRREGQMIAYQICTLHAGILTGLKTSYLEQYAKDSPGQLLHFYIVRWAFAQPDVRIYDMLGPTSQTKLRWATGVDELSTIYVFRRSCGGLLARMRWAAAPRAKAWLRRRLTGTVGRKADAHALATSEPQSALTRMKSDQ